MTIIWIGLDTEDLSEPSFQVEVSSGPIGWGKKLRWKRLVQIFTNIDVSKREALCLLRNNMGKRLDLRFYPRTLTFQEYKNGHAKAVSEIRRINELNKT